jgi:hypothetical protein
MYGFKAFRRCAALAFALLEELHHFLEFNAASVDRSGLFQQDLLFFWGQAMLGIANVHKELVQLFHLDGPVARHKGRENFLLESSRDFARVTIRREEVKESSRWT